MSFSIPHLIAIKRLGAQTGFPCPLPSLSDVIDFPYSHYVKRLRACTGLPRAEFAALLGVKTDVIARWENDEAFPTLESLTDMIESLVAHTHALLDSSNAEISDIASEWADLGLFPHGFVDQRKISSKQHNVIPIVTFELAGSRTILDKHLPIQDVKEHVCSTAQSSPSKFAVRLTCDSMVPEFRPGSIIIADPSESTVPGEFVIAKMAHQNRAIFRKYQVLQDDPGRSKIVRLSPLNDDWPAETISPECPGRIIAPVIEARSFPRKDPF